MDIFISVLLLLIGIVLIVKGGDLFVDAASWIAEVSGIPPLIVGATVVSIATTLPELIVSIIATAKGSVDIAVGNAVGSVVANIGLIMAISLIFMPAVIERRAYLPKSILLFVSIAVLLLLCLNNELNVWWSLIMLALFIVFAYDNVRSAKKEMALISAADVLNNKIYINPENVNTDAVECVDCKLNSEGVSECTVKKDKKTIIVNIVKFLLGAGGIVGGAQLLVTYGQKLAELAGIPEGVIAVTLVAIGTSLPELVTTITAIAKKKSSLSIGNIIGANILDITLILPICVMVSGGSLVVSNQTIILDLPFCLGLAIIGLLPTMITKKFARWQGFALLATYAVYLTLRIIGIGG